MKKCVVYIIVFLCGVAVFFLQFNYGRKYVPRSFYQVYLDNEKIGVITSKEKFEKHVAEQGEIIQNQVIEYQSNIETIESVHNVMKKVFVRGNSLYSNYIYMIKLEDIYNELSSYVDNNGNAKDGKYADLSKLYRTFSDEYKEGNGLTSKGIKNYDRLQAIFDKNIKSYQKDLIDYLYQNRESLNMTSSEVSYLEEFVSNKMIDVSYSRYIYMKNYVNDNEIYLHTTNVLEPLGINIKKITTYDNTYSDIEDIYNKIIAKKPCTIEGYQFRIKVKEDDAEDMESDSTLEDLDSSSTSSNAKSKDIILYVTDEDIFNDAIEEVTKVFVGNEKYEDYQNGTQQEVKTTGTMIDNIYLDDEITVKKTNVSVSEKIYTDSSSLASYLLYGDNKISKTVLASSKDSVDDLAYRNGISVEEFFLSNPSFTSIDNMFYDNQPITITKLNPKIEVIVEESQVFDQTIYYDTIEKADKTMTTGSEYVEQSGQNGIMRVSQTVQKVNGSVVKTVPISNETIKPSRNKVVRVGTHNVPSIGSVRNWLWPTNAYSISSPFGWRTYPFNYKKRELHSGVDIPNNYGKPVYASNNGTIYAINDTRYGYGKHIIINHNNGYCTLYGHMSGFAKGLKKGSVVARGQVIGYIGHSGAATGNHVHFEIRVGATTTKCPGSGGATNPLPYLRK